MCFELCQGKLPPLHWMLAVLSHGKLKKWQEVPNFLHSQPGKKAGTHLSDDSWCSITAPFRWEGEVMLSTISGWEVCGQPKLQLLDHFLAVIWLLVAEHQATSWLERGQDCGKVGYKYVEINTQASAKFLNSLCPSKSSRKCLNEKDYATMITQGICTLHIISKF